MRGYNRRPGHALISPRGASSPKAVDSLLCLLLETSQPRCIGRLCVLAGGLWTFHLATVVHKGKSKWLHHQCPTSRKRQDCAMWWLVSMALQQEARHLVADSYPGSFVSPSLCWCSLVAGQPSVDGHRSFGRKVRSLTRYLTTVVPGRKDLRPCWNIQKRSTWPSSQHLSQYGKKRQRPPRQPVRRSSSASRSPRRS